jgi:hypothetical protein
MPSPSLDEPHDVRDDQHDHHDHAGGLEQTLREERLEHDDW